MDIHKRHPYAGELVFTAFSGSHQDAINKGFSGMDSNGIWDVPYLALDPKDINKTYQAIIRINSQSGKGGVAYILEHHFQCILPKRIQPTVSHFIQRSVEVSGTEITPNEIWHIFETEFINRSDTLQLLKTETQLESNGTVTSRLSITYNQAVHQLSAAGNGPIDATKKALHPLFPTLTVESYAEHSLSRGSDSAAICYLTVNIDTTTFHGVGIDTNITLASIKALISAINRQLASE